MVPKDLCYYLSKDSVTGVNTKWDYKVCCALFECVYVTLLYTRNLTTKGKQYQFEAYFHQHG